MKTSRVFRHLGSVGRCAWLNLCSRCQNGGQHLALLLLAGLACLAGAPSAWAHQASVAYLHWQVQGQRIEQQVEVALRDLDRELALDANNDGQLSWGEVRSRWAELERLVDEGVALQADGQPCQQLTQGSPLLDEHGDGRHAVLRRSWACAAPVQHLEVNYRLFANSDAGHRGLASVETEAGAAPITAVLVPGAGLHSFELASASQSFWRFVMEGMHHIAVGWDHILFLISLLMVAVWQRQGRSWAPRASAAGAWREALRLVSAFTLSHSITLGLAASGVLAPPTRWVESLIALSVVLAAVDNLRPFIPGPRWLMAAVFGLVHGFGFAGPLQDLGLQRGALALPLLGFNLGVELGQLALVLLLLPLACRVRAAPGYRWGVVSTGSGGIAAVALVWLAERSLNISFGPFGFFGL